MCFAVNISVPEWIASLKALPLNTRVPLVATFGLSARGEIVALQELAMEDRKSSEKAKDAGGPAERILGDVDVGMTDSSDHSFDLINRAGRFNRYKSPS